LLLSTALGACTVGPDYIPPKAELAPFHNLVDASTPQAHPAPPLDRWWTGFIVEAPRLAVGKSAAPDPAAAACAWRSRTQRAYGAKTRRAHTGTESSHDSPLEGDGFELPVPELAGVG
jgi:hypothetical protein